MVVGPAEPLTIFAAEGVEGCSVTLPRGDAVAWSVRCPGKDTDNEDAVLIAPLADGSAVLAVADGMGGAAAGERASRLAIEALHEAIAALADGASLRAAIIDGFEEANRRVLDLGIGAGTTLTAVALHQDSVRHCNVGDSWAMITGQRGKLKFQSIPQSPIGYAVEAGLLEEGAAMVHEERHIVSNAIGSREMHIDIGSAVTLAPRDTLLLTSDGITDNLRVEEIVENVRAGALSAAGARLARSAQTRMRGPVNGSPSHADDMSFILYRPRNPPSRS